MRSVSNLMEEFRSHIRKDIQDLVNSGERISYKQYKDLPLNSYERRAITPLLDDDALVKITEYCLMQEGIKELARWRVPDNYKDAVLRLYIHELIKRVKV